MNTNTLVARLTEVATDADAGSFVTHDKPSGIVVAAINCLAIDLTSSHATSTATITVAVYGPSQDEIDKAMTQLDIALERIPGCSVERREALVVTPDMENVKAVRAAITTSLSARTLGSTIGPDQESEGQ